MKQMKPKFKLGTKLRQIKPKFKLGTKLRDKVTDFEGIAIGRMEYLNGCVQYAIKPKMDKDGKYPESQFIDQQQLEELKAKKISVKRKPTGGANMEHPRC